MATTEFTKNQPDRTIEVGGAQMSDDKGDQPKVTVRALRTFHRDANMKGDMVHPGNEFETTRDRAVELRANGLIEYLDASTDKDLHGEGGAKAIADRAAHDAEARKMPDNARTTPLRNPELKLAEVDESKLAKSSAKSGK